MEISETVLLEKTPFEIQYELERGKPLPSVNHSIVESRLSFALSRFEQFDTFPELSLELLSKKATPDICLFKNQIPDWLNDEIVVKESPLLTIEILTLKQSLEDLKDKIFDIYFPAGVKSCWIVVPTLKMIAVFSPNGDVQNYIGGIVKDPALGVEVDMKEIFR